MAPPHPWSPLAARNLAEGEPYHDGRGNSYRYLIVREDTDMGPTTENPFTCPSTHTTAGGVVVTCARTHPMPHTTHWGHEASSVGVKWADPTDPFTGNPTTQEGTST
jgi:hypothetical protein